MNENQNHDKALEDAIERVVHGKKASGNELLDMLGSAKPQADPTFMANLEDRLMAEFSSKEKETIMLKRKERPNKFGRWPLTMAAAILAIILVGGLLLYMQQKPMEVAANPDASPTDIPMIPVVMAIQDIPEGEIIEPNDVALVLLPAENAPIDALSSIEDAVGSYARTTIYREEIVLSRKLIQSSPMDALELTMTAVSANATQQASTMIPVVIAIQDIPAGTEITPDRVTLMLFPVENVPQSAMTSMADVVGQYAFADIYREEVILARKISERSPISMTATAQARASQSTSELNPANAVPIIYNAPEKQGCDAGTSLQVPANGQVVNSPILVRGMAQHDDFAQAKIEISGPSTNNEWVVIANVMQEIPAVTEFGQFVPSLYETGTYQFRLQTFSSLANLVAYCTITIYISDETSQSDLLPVVIAIQDIPMNTLITQDMLSLVYWPQDVATEYASTHTGQWFNNQIAEIVGKQSRTFIPALTPISDDWYGVDNPCTSNGSVVDNCAYTIPDTTVAIAITTEDMSATSFIAGQYVDVIASFMFAGEGNGSSVFVENNDGSLQSVNPVEGNQLVMRRIAVNALVIQTETVSIDGTNQVLLTLATSPESATVLSWLIEADISYLVVPHLEGAEASPIETATIPTEAPVAEDEITAYYPIAEDFVGNYDAITTDSRALFVAVMPANINEALLAGVPLYITGDGRKVLAFEVTAQIGAYTYTREDGSVETGRSARLLLSTREANWLEQLRLAGVRYQYSLIPLNRMDMVEIAPTYPASEDGRVLISIPLTETMSVSYGLIAGTDVQIQIRPISDSPSMIPVPSGSTISWQNVAELDQLIRVDGAEVRYIGTGIEANDFPLPHAQYEAGQSFITLEVNAEDAWLIDWYLNYGSEFGLVEQ